MVLLAVGGSSAAAELVTAHSGALAGADATWEALTEAHGLLRVQDLDEMTDAARAPHGRAARGRTRPGFSGLATVHDSGAERVLVADVARRGGVPFAVPPAATEARLAALLDQGLEAGNPLDVWGGGRDTEELFTSCLSALADDPAVDVVALAVDLVPEYDGDVAFPQRHGAAARADPQAGRGAGQPGLGRGPGAAARLRSPASRSSRAPVGLLALRHLRAPAPPPAGSPGRRTPAGQRWVDRLAGSDRVRDWPRRCSPTTASLRPLRWVSPREEAVAAAAELGGTVVLKTAPGMPQGRRGRGPAGLVGPTAVGAAYDDLAGRLGPQVQVQQQVASAWSSRPGSCATRCSGGWWWSAPAAPWSSCSTRAR